LTGDPVAPAPTVGPGTLWPDSLGLIDVAKDNNERASSSDRQSIVFPCVDPAGQFVYAAQQNVVQKAGSLDLLRFDLATGKGGVISSYSDSSPVAQAPYFNFADANGISAAIAGDYYVLCTRSHIVLYPLDGG